LITITSCTFCVAEPIEGGLYIGSKQSDKYHLPGCEWAKKIATRNRRWFGTVAEAKTAGYRACSVCGPTDVITAVEGKTTREQTGLQQANRSRTWMYYFGGLIFFVGLVAVVRRGIKKRGYICVKERGIKSQSQQHAVRTLLEKPDAPIPDREMGKAHVCDDVEFWSLFPRDLNNAQSEIIIVSPFVNKYRAEGLTKVFMLLRRRRVKIRMYIRPLNDDRYGAEAVLDTWKTMGVEIVYREGIHHKAAVIDRVIAWEGSLNILQHWKSKEHMTRHEDPEYIKQLMDVLEIR